MGANLLLQGFNDLFYMLSYEVLMPRRLNQLNLDMLDLKQENSLKEQEIEFLTTIDAEKSEKVKTVRHNSMLVLPYLT